jgi:hypothetical protein
MLLESTPSAKEQQVRCDSHILCSLSINESSRWTTTTRLIKQNEIESYGGGWCGGVRKNNSLGQRKVVEAFASRMVTVSGLTTKERAMNEG